MSRITQAVACVVLLVSIAGAPASAGEFKRYQQPDPKQFAQGLAAYDAGDFDRAFKIWLPLAQHGDLAAVFNIGLMLRDGRGVPKDLPRALTFFQQCAEWQTIGCQVNLADMYYRGEGTPRDYAEAAKWLMVASRRGHYPSMYKLAEMFEHGEGVEQNLKAARTLYLIAYEGGYQLAGNRLSQLAAKTDEARAPSEPSRSGTAEASNIPPPSLAPEPRLRPANADAQASAVPRIELRGPLGAGGSDFDTASDPIFTLRSSFASMSKVEHQIYGIGWTVKTIEGLPDAPAVSPPRRGCANGSQPFDPRRPVCRMPPVRD